MTEWTEVLEWANNENNYFVKTILNINQNQLTDFEYLTMND